MTPIEVTQSYTVSALGPSGDGLCDIGGRWVKVKGALPGERVRVRREGHALVVTSSEGRSCDRVLPLCPIVGACGGCVWQHASQTLQQKTRLELLRRGLPPALRELAVQSQPSVMPYSYRTRARMAWRVERGSVVLGFHQRGASEVAPVSSCAVLDPRLDLALPALRAALGPLGARGWVSIALGRRGAPVASLRPESRVTTAGFCVPEVLVSMGFAGVALWPNGATVALSAGDPRPVLRGADNGDLVLAPDGFAQAHEELNRELVEYVVGETMAASRSLIELFAGAGNFTVMLAQSAQKVTAVESDKGAVAALIDNLKARGLTRVVVREGLAEVVLAETKGEVVLLDPPREGAREVCKMLLARKLRRVVYVSCDSATLGRDLGELSPKYEVLALKVFEMFPQTPHLETVATLAPKRV